MSDIDIQAVSSGKMTHNKKAGAVKDVDGPCAEIDIEDEASSDEDDKDDDKED